MEKAGRDPATIDFERGQIDAMIPRATYRLQFHNGFTFDNAAALAPYFDRLAISHIYASPILTARAGSTHGYDVVDHGAINPELGGETGFLHMAEALKARQIGIVLDIVPNHMAVGGADNRWWLDLLEHGRASRYAAFFDIDFDCANPALAGKVDAPFLGAPYGEVLRSGELKPVWDEGLGKFAIAYHHHRFPIRPEDHDDLQGDLTRFEDPDTLHSLLEKQNFRLSWWRTAGDEINWRRFFDVTELAALRVEQAEVFEAVHAVAFDLYARGTIDGVRVDHVDGLADPAAYCRKLRERLDALNAMRPTAASPGPAYLIVEKILGAGETIPPSWRVDGTTGYDFMDQVSALQHDTGGETSLTLAWTAIGGRNGDFEAEEKIARDEILFGSFDGQLASTALAFHKIALSRTSTRDFTEAAVKRALVRIVRYFRVYRTYATGMPDSPAPGPAFDRAIALAKQDFPTEGDAIQFIADTMAGSDSADAVRRFNQLAAPLAAKSVEDTAFYRYGRLLSRNDVGFDPRHLGMRIEDFHACVSNRAAHHPNAMLTTATHDHKRGEDMRARLAVISEMPGKWLEAIAHWTDLNAAVRPDGLYADDEYQLYQTLAGAWPFGLDRYDAEGLQTFRKRVEGWRIKSLREAKLRSSWAAPDEGYEAANRDFLAKLLDPARSPEFMDALCMLVNSVAAAGAMNGLTQLVLRYTLPGVPDLYQGGEFWDFSLVDPDNRQAVDYEARSQALNADIALNDYTETWRDGRIKQHIANKLLMLRKTESTLFTQGDYTPLTLTGPRADRAIAFSRTAQGRQLIVAVPLHCASILAGSELLVPPAAWWMDTVITLPQGGGAIATDIINGREVFTLGNRFALQNMATIPAIILVR